jgi:hypothetical protein
MRPWPTAKVPPPRFWARRYLGAPRTASDSQQKGASLECRRLRCWLHIFDLSALEMGESVPDDTQRCNQRH